MSKHKMVNGQLLQMDKSYSQLKTRQKEKIAAWMYEAYKKQVEEDLTNEEALDIVYSRIEDAGIWIPDYEIEKKSLRHFLWTSVLYCFHSTIRESSMISLCHVVSFKV